MTTHNTVNEHNYLMSDDKIKKNEGKTFKVVLLTFVTMIVEVIAGYMTGSMALLADGWHMASHAGALTISLLAYKLAQSSKWTMNFSFGGGKVIPLGGYTSAVVLGLIAILMGYHSIERVINPVGIHFNEAIVIAVIGLIVNIVSAFILFDDHHHHHDGHTHDHNLKSAYIHVIADALTSILAIVALIFGKIYGFVWLDPLMGILGSILIFKWAIQLCRETVWELLDGHAKQFDFEEVKRKIEDLGVEVIDLHIWRIAPNAHACEVVLIPTESKGCQFYKTEILKEFHFEHLIVEEANQPVV